MKNFFTTYKTYIAIAVVGMTVVVALTWWGVMRINRNMALYSTFFTYDYTDPAFRKLPVPSLTTDIESASIFSLDDQVFAIVSEEKLSATAAARLYAYIATAEHEVIMLAKRMGNARVAVQPVVRSVVCTFVPNGCGRVVAVEDAYSQALADIVMKQIIARNTDDAAQLRNYVRHNPQTAHWDPAKKYSGEDVGGWKPWRIEDVQRFRAAPPFALDSAEGVAQVQDVVTTLATLTDAQRDNALEHSMARGTGTVSASVIKEMSALQRAAGTDIVTVARERLMLTQAVVDALIIAYDTKYTYWYPRPDMLDTTIKPLTPTPADPSYPSTSVAAEATGIGLLEMWYPEHRSELEARLTDVANARVHAGIHFPKDVEASKRIGAEVVKFYYNPTIVAE